MPRKFPRLHGKRHKDDNVEGEQGQSGAEDEEHHHEGMAEHPNIHDHHHHHDDDDDDDDDGDATDSSHLSSSDDEREGDQSHDDGVGTRGAVPEIEHEIELSSTSKIIHVTVFQDRAEVTREVPLCFDAPGLPLASKTAKTTAATNTVDRDDAPAGAASTAGGTHGKAQRQRHLFHLRGLSSTVRDEASIRVQGVGAFTILSMATFTTMAPPALSEEDEQRLEEAQGVLAEPKPLHPETHTERDARAQRIQEAELRLTELQERLDVVTEARNNLATYANSIVGAKPSTTDGAALTQLLQPDSVFGVVDACQQRSTALLDDMTALRRDIREARRTLEEDVKQRDELQAQHDKAISEWEARRDKAAVTKKEIESRPKVSRRDATVVVERAATAIADASAKLALSYVVSSACWKPCYDLRANLDTGEIELRYHGEVRQTTDEPWHGVRLTLSTATPAVGGHPPKLTPLYFGQKVSRPRHYGGLADIMDTSASFKKASATSLGRARSRAARGAAVEKANEAAAPPPPAPAASVAMSSVNKGSTSLATAFDISGRTTVTNGDKSQRVTLGIMKLKSRLRYFCVPRLSQAAYLQAYCTNTSTYPLLPSDTVNVFVNANLVTTTELRLVVPGESFSAFLGVDSGVRVTYKPAPQTDGVVRGLFYGSTRKQEMRAACVIENLNPRPHVVVVADAFPQSKHNNIKIRLLKPNPDTVEEDETTQTDDTLCGGGLAQAVDPATKRLPAVVKNKYTNSLIWTCYLESRQKQELQLEYVVEYPTNMSIEASSS